MVIRRAVRPPPLITHDIAGDGPAVVLLHAAIGDRRLWDYQWPWLTTAHRTLRVDLAGYGETPLPHGPYCTAADMVDLLELVGVAPAVLVGGSMGARVALEIAVARPDIAAGLVLVSPLVPGHDWSDEVRAFGDAEDEALDRGDIEVAVELNLRMWFDGSRPREAVDSGRRSAVGAMQRRAFELQRAVPDADEELLVPDLAARIAEISVPTRIVVGEHDASDFHAIGAQLAAGMADARVEVLARTAHVPNYERPDLFDPLLRDALNS